MFNFDKFVKNIENNVDTMRQNTLKIREMYSVQTREKLKAIMRAAKKYKSPHLYYFLHEVILKLKYNLDKEMTVVKSDEFEVIKTCDPELFKSVPESKLEIKESNDNPHDVLHTQRIHLMNYGIKKYFGIKEISELPKTVKIVMISPASNLYLNLFYTHNVFINQAMTNDPNDRERLVKLIFNLIKIAPSIEALDKLGSNICTCYQGEERCSHTKIFGHALYLLPHSIYYLKDQFINNLLKEGIEIIFTAHVIKENSTGKVERILMNKIENEPQIVTDREYYKMNTQDDITSIKLGAVKKKRRAVTKYEIASWKSENGWVDFEVKDDKYYNHQNFLPELYRIKNITTEYTITRVYKYFIFENMIHVVGVITGTEGHDNDFRSYTEAKTRYNNYEILPGTQINLINENTVGRIYMKEDEKTQRCALMRVYESQSEIFTFRFDQFSMINRLGWKVGHRFTEQEYIDFTRQMYIKKKGNKIVVSNEAMNGLLESLLNTTYIDSNILISMWKRCLATFGSSAVDQDQIYDIMTLLLFEALKTKIYINHLGESDLVTAYNNLLKKTDHSLYTRFVDWLVPSKTELKNKDLLNQNKIKDTIEQDEGNKEKQVIDSYKDKQTYQAIEIKWDKKKTDKIINNILENFDTNENIERVITTINIMGDRVVRMKTPTKKRVIHKRRNISPNNISKRFLDYDEYIKPRKKKENKTVNPIGYYLFGKKKQKDIVSMKMKKLVPKMDYINQNMVKDDNTKNTENTEKQYPLDWMKDI
jgi:hypothetical protein